MMKRRHFLRCGLAAGLTAGFAPVMDAVRPHAAPAVQTKRRLRFAMAYPIAASGPADEAFRLARSIERALPECAIDLVYEPGDAVSVLGMNRADAYFGPLASDLAPEPALALFGGGHAPPTATNLDDCLATLSVRCIATAEEGRGGGLWSRRPIEDLSNVRIATSGLAAEIWRGLGAHPMRIAPDRLTAALNDRTIEAIECPSIETAAALGVLAAASHCLTGGPARRNERLAMCFRSHVWAGLALAEQTQLATLTSSSFAQRARRLEGEARALRRSCEAAFGLRFDAMSPANEAAAHRIASAVVAEIATRTPLARRLAAHA